MRKPSFGTYLGFLLVVLLCLATAPEASARKPKEKKKSKTEQPVREEAGKRYKVEGGIRRDATVSRPDTLPGSGIDTTAAATQEPVLKADTLQADTAATAQAAALKGKKHKEADTSSVRYSKLFRDTIPVSRVMALSLPLPGFAQVYNKQAWKVPVFWGSTGTLLYFGIQQNKEYKSLKSEVDKMKASGAAQEDLDPVQREMIVKNSTRSLLLAGAVASWMYFMADGVINYQGLPSNVKKATTLSMICPGLGQIYNRSYWKTPIIVGAFTTMAYVINYNSRGYTRYKTAYDLRTDGNPDTHDEFEDYSYVTPDYLKTLKNNFRRSRDLAIILTAGLYILQIIDAHVEAQLKNYDISDNLAFTVEPTLMQYYTRNNSPGQGIGLSFKFKF